MKKYLWIELFLLLLIFLSFCYAITLYPTLPAKIPAHFNIDGKPDVWHIKSWNTVLALPYFTLGLYILLTVSILIINKAQNPIRFINFPVSSARVVKLSREFTEVIREMIIKAIIVTKNIITVMFLYLFYITIQTAHNIKREELSWFMWLFILLLFGLWGYTIFNVYKVIWAGEQKRA